MKTITPIQLPAFIVQVKKQTSAKGMIGYKLPTSKAIQTIQQICAAFSVTELAYELTTSTLNIWSTDMVSCDIRWSTQSGLAGSEYKDWRKANTNVGIAVSALRKGLAGEQLTKAEQRFIHPTLN